MVDGNSSGKADIEPMQVPHRSNMNYWGTMPLGDSYEPTIPESEVHEEEEEPQSRRALTNYYSSKIMLDNLPWPRGVVVTSLLCPARKFEFVHNDIM